MDNNIIIKIEKNGISILEKWIQETFLLFGDYGLEAKVNIPVLFNDLDSRSAKILRGYSQDDLLALFIASLKLFGHQNMTVLNTSLNEAHIQSSVNDRQHITFLSLNINQNVYRKDVDPEQWSILRLGENISSQNSLQQILIAFSALAFIPEFVEHSGEGGVDRKTYKSLDSYVSPLCYPNDVRISIRSKWNALQNINNGSFTI